ncbi:MAG TPA: pseudouridine-5'-phosphate glycosidase [Jatrophihabitans sp.]
MLITPEVTDALAGGGPVVALESTIISHGLPRPDNLRIAREIEQAVRDEGSVPATIAIIDGEAHIGLDDVALEKLAMSEDVVKTSVRDMGTVAAKGLIGATTVASTAHLASAAGISVFATGGLGGVHRGATETWDESADLVTLSRSRIIVVCAGVKSILDVPATLERLETLNISVLGYRTDAFPGFYLQNSGYAVDWRVESPLEVADIFRAQADMGQSSGTIVANPIAERDELDLALHDRVLASGLATAEEQRVTGKAVTPFLLAWFHEQTHGASLAANVALVLSNARLAAAVAGELAR